MVFTIDTSKVYTQVPGFQLLRGRDNYIQWARDVRVFAAIHGVWNLVIITQENSAIPVKPIFDSYFQAPKLQDGTTPELSSTDMQVRKLHFDYALKEYYDACERFNATKAMLIGLVGTSIRNSLIDLRSPRAMWQYLGRMYRHSQSTMYAKIDELHLQNCKDISDFFNQLNDLVYILKEAGGDYDDVQCMCKVMRSLTPNYRTFVIMWNRTYVTETTPWSSVEDLEMKLLSYESQLKLRNDIEKSEQKKNRGSERQNRVKELERPDRVKCSTVGCQGFNHSPEDCWILHPEKKPKWNRGKHV